MSETPLLIVVYKDDNMADFGPIDFIRPRSNFADRCVARAEEIACAATICTKQTLQKDLVHG